MIRSALFRSALASVTYDGTALVGGRAGVSGRFACPAPAGADLQLRVAAPRAAIAARRALRAHETACAPIASATVGCGAITVRSVGRSVGARLLIWIRGAFVIAASTAFDREGDRCTAQRERQCDRNAIPHDTLLQANRSLARAVGQSADQGAAVAPLIPARNTASKLDLLTSNTAGIGGNEQSPFRMSEAMWGEMSRIIAEPGNARYRIAGSRLLQVGQTTDHDHEIAAKNQRHRPCSRGPQAWAKHSARRTS